MLLPVVPLLAQHARLATSLLLLALRNVSRVLLVRQVAPLKQNVLTAQLASMQTRMAPPLAVHAPLAPLNTLKAPLAATPVHQALTLAMTYTVCLVCLAPMPVLATLMKSVSRAPRVALRLPPRPVSAVRAQLVPLLLVVPLLVLNVPLARNNLCRERISAWIVRLVVILQLLVPLPAPWPGLVITFPVSVPLPKCNVMQVRTLQAKAQTSALPVPLEVSTQKWLLLPALIVLVENTGVARVA